MSMMLNLTRTSYKKGQEFKIIGLGNYSTGKDDKITQAPTVDYVDTPDKIYLIFVIYLCIALLILVWLVRKRWNAKTKSRQDAGHVDSAPPECSK